jgi:hypothetical protein
MSFTEKIIAGKDVRIEELEALLEKKLHDYQDLEVEYDHAIMQRDARIAEMQAFKDKNEETTENIHEIYK